MFLWVWVVTIYGWVDFSCFCVLVGVFNFIFNNRMLKDGFRCILEIFIFLLKGKDVDMYEGIKEVIIKFSVS